MAWHVPLAFRFSHCHFNPLLVISTSLLVMSTLLLVISTLGRNLSPSFLRAGSGGRPHPGIGNTTSPWASAQAKISPVGRDDKMDGLSKFVCASRQRISRVQS